MPISRHFDHCPLKNHEDRTQHRCCIAVEATKPQLPFGLQAVRNTFGGVARAQVAVSSMENTALLVVKLKAMIYLNEPPASLYNG